MTMMKYVCGFFLCLLLAACNSGPETTATTTANNTMTVTLIDSVTGQPIAGATVQLDQNGVTATSNANGVAFFLNVSAGAHDIHMYATNYEWDSIYQTTSLTVQWSLSDKRFSFVNFQGTVANMGATTLELWLLDTAVGQSYTGNCTIAPVGFYSCSLKVINAAIGTQGNFDLWAVERNASRSIVNAVQLQGKNTFVVSTVASATLAPLTQNITMGAVPAVSSTVTINAVTAPLGMPAPQMSMRDGNAMQVLSLSSFTPVTLSAFNPFVLTANNALWAEAFVLDANQNMQWDLMQKTTNGSTIQQMVANITALPVMGAQNLGGIANPVLSFQAATGLFSAYSVAISDVNGNILWNMTLPSNLSQATLPTVPANIMAILTAGGNYKVEVYAVYVDNVSYEQSITGIGLKNNLSSYNVIELGSTGFQSLVR